MPDTVDLTAMSATRLPALLQLASAALPIGGFGYSGGLESAVEAGIVRDEATAQAWLVDLLQLIWTRGEAPLWCGCYEAWASGDNAAIAARNDQALAMRDTAELRLESEQMGRSLALWLLTLPRPALLDEARAAQLAALRPIAHSCAHAAACWSLGLSPRDGLHALGWSLLESLTLAAVKLVPLGQDQGQRALRHAALKLDDAVTRALQRAPDDACNFAPMLAWLSCRHESQYTRLFRS